MADKKKKNMFLNIFVVLIVVILIFIGILFSESSEEPTKKTLTKEEINALITKANEVYDEDNYELASSLFKQIVENGYKDGMTLYRYAYSIFNTKGYDPVLYINAFISLAKEDSENVYTKRAFEKIKNNAIELEYRKAMLNDYSNMDIVQLQGEVSQIFQDNNALLDTNKADFLGYSGDKVWLYFENKPRILEEDILLVIGHYKGTRKYETVLGNTAEVPYIEVIGMEIFFYE